ncbi:MAG TPA: MFS transporter [Holophagaceae bacterium]
MIVASTFAVYAFSYGVYYSFSVYYVALLEEFGWTRASTAGVFSLFVLVTGIGGIAGGALLDRFGPGRVMAVGGIVLSAGLVATSRLTQLWEFYLYFGFLCGLGLALTGWVAGITVVSRWFSSKQGIAVGIASAGIGLGTVVMAPLSQYLISTAGWRSAYLFLAATTLVGIAPQALMLQVGRPEELGLKPDGRNSGAGASTQKLSRLVKVVDPEWAGRAWSVASAMETSRFWLMAGTYFCAVLAQQLVFVHQAAYLVDGGYDKMLAASVVGMIGFLSMFAKVGLGEVGDRIGRERSFTIGCACALLALGVLVLARVTPSVWLVFVFAAFFTVGYAATPANLSTAAADLFASRNFGAIYGAICIGQGVGSAIGAWIAGFIFDATGSYLAAFGVGAVSVVLSGVFLWLAAPRLVRRVVRTP